MQALLDRSGLRKHGCLYLSMIRGKQRSNVNDIPLVVASSSS